MNAPPIVPLIAASFAFAAVLGCSALEKPTAAALQEKVEAALEAKLEVLSNEKNLERIEQITDAILKADATRKVARELAAGAVLGLSEASQEEALRVAASGLVDALARALAGEGGEGLDADLSGLVRGAAAAVAEGVLDDSVREDATRFAGDLSQVLAAAVAEEAAARLPAILDASYQRLSPRLGETLEREIAPALAAALTEELAPALAASLEGPLGPALETLLAERLLPAVERAASERLPPLVRDSTREAMLGLGDALEGELGEQARTFVHSLIKGSKAELLPAAARTGAWLLPAAAVALLAAILAGVYFWRRARDHRREARARESALFLLANTVNRLPDELQGRVKAAVAEAGGKAGGERTGGAELRLFLDRHNL